MGTLFFILLIVLLLALLLGAGGYGVRRYWSPAGTEMVTTGDPGAGALGGFVVAILAFLVMIMLFFGFTQWNWFSAQPGPAQNPAVSSPAPSGGGGGASPMASPSK